MSDEKAIGLTQAQQHQAQVAAAQRAEPVPIPIWDDEHPDPGQSAEPVAEAAPVADEPTAESAPEEVTETPVTPTESVSSVFDMSGDIEPTAETPTRYTLVAPEDEESDVGFGTHGGRMGGWSAMTDLWAMSRDADSSVAALARRNMEDDFKVDEYFNAGEHLDEYMYEVPEELKGQLQQKIIDRAVNHEHAQWIAGRFKEEVMQDAEIAKYGGLGLTVRIAANILDEGALATGILTGPVGAAAFKFNRIKAALAAGGLAMAENTAIEAHLIKGSVTRETEDLLYAAAFGAALGGGAGALFSKGAKKAPEVDADGNVIPEVDAATQRAHDGTRAPETEAERGQRQLDEIDQGVIEDARRDVIAETEGKAPELTTDTMPPAGREHLDQMEVHTDAQVQSLPDNPKLEGDDIPEVPKRDFDAELAKVDADIEAAGKAVKPRDEADVDPQRAADELEELEFQLDFARRVRDGEQTLSQKDTINSKAELQAQARATLKEYRALDPDGYEEVVGASRNPTMEALEEMLPRLKTAIGKAHAKATKAAAEQAETLDRLGTLKDELLEAREAAGAAESTMGGAVGSANVNFAGEFGPVDLDNTTDGIEEMINNHVGAAFVRRGDNQGDGQRIRIDMKATAEASPEKLHAVLGDLIGEEGVGKIDHSLSEVSASEAAELLYNANIAKVERVFRVAEKEWMEEMGIPLTERWRPSHKRAFSEQVTDEVEFGGAESAAVKKAAGATAELFTTIAKAAKKGDVEGFRDFDIHKSYIPRIHDSLKFADAYHEYGAEAIMELVRRAIRNAQPDVDPDLARRIAKGYVDGVQLRGAGVNASHHDLGIDSVEYIEGVLKDLGIGDEDTRAFVSAMTGQTKEGKQAGMMARAKKRLLMDMETSLKVRNQDGELVDLELKSLFVRDAHALTKHYTKTVGGMASIANRTKGTALHIRSKRDFERVLKLARRRNLAAGRKSNKNLISADSFDAGEKALRTMFNRTVGTPLHDVDDGWVQNVRRLKDYNFARVMGQVAFAQLSEMGTAIATVGFKNSLRAMPHLRTIMKRSKETGRLDNDMAAVVEDFLGLGTDRLNDRVLMRGDIEGEVLAQQAETMYDQGMHAINKMVARPMQTVMEIQQRMTAIGLMQNFTDWAHKGKIPKRMVKRLAGVGIDEARWEKIQAQLLKHSKTKKTMFGQTLKHPSLENWDDADALEHFTLALRRMTTRAIQENSIGTTSQVSNTLVGSLATQFRGFMMVSFHKQLLHGAHHWDLQTGAMMTLSTMFAALGYGAQLEFKSIGRPDRDEYRKKYITPENLARAAFQRSAWASFMPAIADGALAAMGQDGVFDYRSSGLANSPADSVPTIDLMKKMKGGLTSIPRAVFNDDVQYTRRNFNDLRYSLPTANAIITNSVWNAVGGLFPESSKQE